MVSLFEQFHSIGYVYNDLKADNICVGEYQDLKTMNKLKLIDFGLATPYLEYNESL